MNISAPNPRGSIHLHLGCMFAGKTTSGLAQLDKFVQAGVRCGAVKFSGDDRYSATAIMSHAGAVCPTPTHSISDLAELCAIIAEHDYSVVFVDEFQFYANPLAIVPIAAKGVKIILTALDGDASAVMFPNVVVILPHADRIKKYTAICRCSEPAIYTVRHTGMSQTAQVDIGGAEKYSARCRTCVMH